MHYTHFMSTICTSRLGPYANKYLAKYLHDFSAVDLYI